MTGFLRDLRYGVRSLGRTPLLTSVLLATVAIGIGAYAAIAAFTNGFLTGTVAVIGTRGAVTIVWHEGADRQRPVPYAAFVTLRARSTSFSALAAFHESRVNVSSAGRTAWMTAAAATPDLWTILRVDPILGHMTLASDPKSGTIDVILSNRTWQDEFGSRRDIVGAMLDIGGRQGRIVAVAPPAFDGVYVGRQVDLWVPLDATEGARGVEVVGRLKRGTTLDTAQREAASIDGSEPGPTVLEYSGVEPDARARLARLRRVLAWTAMLVLLTAAANVAGFLLSRAARRSHETAARIALGAPRARLASQIAADSLLVSVGGGALAVFVAYWTASVMPALLYVEDARQLVLAPHASQITLTTVMLMMVMLVCGLAPVAELRRHQPMMTLREGGPSVTSNGWLRSALVIAQMGACVVLVVAAALLLADFRSALRSVRGERIGQPIVATLEASARFSNERAGRDMFRQAQDEAMTVPRVGGVAWVATLPGGRAYESGFRIDPSPAGWHTVAIDTATPAGRDLLSLKVIAGRPFGGQDGPATCRVALVNQSAAKAYFDGGAVGRSFRDSSDRRVDIVDVVQPPKEDSDPRIYFFERQRATGPSQATARESIRVPFGSASAAPADLEQNIATSAYFDTIDARFETGHNFDDAAPCGVAVVNREAADAYFSGRAVGGAVIDNEGRRAEIVGVVDAGVLLLMQQRPRPMVYFPMSQRYAPQMTLIAQARSAPPAMVTEMARRLHDVPGARQPPMVETLERRLSRTALGPERIAAVVVGTAASIALALGLLGVYGVMSDAVLQRKREIAIRLALGAQSWRIVGAVIADGARIAAAGGSAGLAAAWATVVVVRHLEPATAALPLWIWAAGPLTLILVVAIASIFPARWALSVDPLTLTREG